MPFSKTNHLVNAWNEHKPVKIGRDGQVYLSAYRSAPPHMHNPPIHRKSSHRAANFSVAYSSSTTTVHSTRSSTSRKPAPQNTEIANRLATTLLTAAVIKTIIALKRSHTATLAMMNIDRSIIAAELIPIGQEFYF